MGGASYTMASAGAAALGDAACCANSADLQTQYSDSQFMMARNSLTHACSTSQGLQSLEALSVMVTKSLQDLRCPMQYSRTIAFAHQRVLAGLSCKVAWTHRQAA